MTHPASRPDQPRHNNTGISIAFRFIGYIFVVGIIIAIISIAFLPSTEEIRVNTFIETTCLVEGYPDYKVIKDTQDHWRGFCTNAIESVEIPMHPDLNLSD